MADPHSENSTSSHGSMSMGVEPSMGDSSWGTCPSGTLARFASARRNRLLRQRVMQGATVLVVCALLIAPVVWFIPPTGEPPAMPRYGGLSCREVVDRMDDFFAATLERPFRQRVLQHLHDCPRCQRHYDEAARELNLTIDTMALEPLVLSTQMVAFSTD